MKKALLVVDYTYDFVATDGKLICSEPGQALDQFRLGVIAADALLSRRKHLPLSLRVRAEKTVLLTLRFRTDKLPLDVRS